MTHGLTHIEITNFSQELLQEIYQGICLNSRESRESLSTKYEFLKHDSLGVGGRGRVIKKNVYKPLNNLRKRYLSPYYCKHPSVIKMNQLLY